MSDNIFIISAVISFLILLATTALILADYLGKKR
jgi:hypothetical protein